MPRRSSTRTSTTKLDTLPAQQPSTSTSAISLADNLLELRRQWKWAAFTQFFYTFAYLFAMNDITVTDIENDLVYSTNTVLPRIMQRLLYTLSYDRKVSLSNWQTVLRKQYLRRDPQANLFGAELQHAVSRLPSESVDPGSELAAKMEVQEEDLHRLSLIDNSRERSLAPDTALTESSRAYFDRDLDDIKIAVESSVDNGETEVSPHDGKDWLELPMLVKLDSMHLLTEWQFHNPTRLRTLMKSDDEDATWRIEPVGYDSKRNAYWLIGDERLWIQRVPPRPNLKRKRREPTTPKVSRPTPAKRPHTQPIAMSQHRGIPRHKHIEASSPVGRGGGRAAKAQAQRKLDAQAKDLAEFRKQVAAEDNRKQSGKRQIVTSIPSNHPIALRRPVGTRLSARLRGDQDDEWQPVPQEWLQDCDNVPQSSHTSPSRGTDRKPKTGLESDLDSISDLTELSDDSEPAVAPGGEEPSTGQPSLPLNPDEPEPQPLDNVPDEQPDLPADFVEWETICATLDEWEHIPKRFENATHYAEKALYKSLVNQIVPAITERLRDMERKRRLEDAIVHRKRSSRIAIKESEKEEARLAAKRRAEEEEKMGRARRLEARLRREEAERERRENARELRRREREAKEATQEMPEEESSPTRIDVISDTPATNGAPNIGSLPSGDTSQINGAKPNGSSSGSRTPVGDDWELDCEICHQRGINLDDGTPMMCCGSCSKWQHILCHDRVNQQAGLPKRDWELEEFLCSHCRSRVGARKTTGFEFRRPETFYVPGYNAASSDFDNRPISSDRVYRNGDSYYQRHALNGSAQYVHSGTDHPVAVASHERASSQGAIAFSHYVPQQRSFTASQSFYNNISSPPNNNSHSLNIRMPLTPQHSIRSPVAWAPSPIQRTPQYSNSYNMAMERSELSSCRPDPRIPHNFHANVSASPSAWQPYLPYLPPNNSPESQNHLRDQYTYRPTSYQSRS